MLTRYFLLGCLLLAACGPRQAVQEVSGKAPSPTSFWYYDPDFQLDSLDSQLQTEGLYFRIHEVDAFGDIYQMFRFQPNGLVIAYIVYNTPDKIAEQPPISQGNIHGYYTVKQDSVFFTTKVYYDHNPTFYKGRIYPDSMVLDRRNYKTKSKGKSTYYFYRK